MKVHHLNLCTMCPFGGRLISGGARSIFDPGELVAHALLVETARDGLVLVDTGLGLADVRAPRQRLGVGFMAFVRPALSEEDTAVRQIERLGYARGDVRHVVVTHLDLDHAGGISDFPDATVHVHRREHDATIARRTRNERQRYMPVQLAHGPKWQLYDDGGERWFGLESLKIIADDVLLVPLPGHSRGHSAVAVRASSATRPSRWLLHCGDAYFWHGEKDDAGSCPPLLRTLQAQMADDDRARRANAARLRELHREHGAEVTLFSAHSPEEYRTLAGSLR